MKQSSHSVAISILHHNFVLALNTDVKEDHGLPLMTKPAMVDDHSLGSET